MNTSRFFYSIKNTIYNKSSNGLYYINLDNSFSGKFSLTHELYKGKTSSVRSNNQLNYHYLFFSNMYDENCIILINNITLNVVKGFCHGNNEPKHCYEEYYFVDNEANLTCSSDFFDRNQKFDYVKKNVNFIIEPLNDYYNGNCSSNCFHEHNKLSDNRFFA